MARHGRRQAGVVGWAEVEMLVQVHGSGDREKRIGNHKVEGVVAAFGRIQEVNRGRYKITRRRWAKSKITSRYGGQTPRSSLSQRSSACSFLPACFLRLSKTTAGTFARLKVAHLTWAALEG